MEAPTIKPIAETAVEPKKPGSSKFGPGNNANPHGCKGKPKPELRTDTVSQLEAMRAVQGQREDQDATVQQAELRKWLKKDVRQFMGKLLELERLAGNPPPAGQGGVVPVPVVEPDVGTEVCVGLCVKLLEGWKHDG